MSLFDSLGQIWSRQSQAKKSAKRQRNRNALSKRGLLFESLEDRSLLAITQIASSDFINPRVQDFQAEPTGPIASNAAAFQAIGISSITSTSSADVDTYSTGSPTASRALAATSTGLRVIDPNSGNASDRFGNFNSYTINFAQPQTRFGFTNDDSGGSGFTFNIVLFSGGTQVDSGSLSAPVFGRNPLYFSSTVAFDSVFISNSFGDGFVIDNLTTESPLPTVTAPTVSNVTSNSATLGGNVTADNGAAITERGILLAKTSVNNNPQLNGNGVTKITATGTTGIFTVNATSLDPLTGYSYVAFATNSEGTSYTAVETFSTLALATLTTPTATSVTATSARIGGSLTNDGGSTVTNFGYVYAKTADDSTPQIGEANVSRVTVLAGGISNDTSFGNLPLTGLQPATQYSLATYAINAGGTSYSTTITFTTLAAAPTVTTPTAANITSNSATLGGNVTADGGSAITERGILLATTSDNNNPQLNGNGVIKLIATGTTGVFTVDATSLLRATGYSYVAYATNVTGTTYSTVETFTTLAELATLPTPNVNNIGTTSASLSGSLTSTGGANVTEFGYLLSKTADDSTPQIGEANVTKVVILDGTIRFNAAFTRNINDLQPATGYSYAVYAINSVGTAYSTVVNFTTLVAAPSVTTPTAANITSNSATLGGNVTADNGAAITERGILLAKTSVNNNPQLNGVGVTKLTATGTTGIFTVDATGLDPALGYSYVVYATNSVGTTYTTVDTFTTLGVAPTVTSPTATNVAVTTATLGGNVASDGQVAITERGIVYAITSINANPQINGTGVTKVTTTGTTGVFTIDVTGIPSGKQISYAAYATNALGTSYSTVGTFTTAPAVGQLGGVTVQVIGNQLVITGDNKPDRLSLTGTANPNEFIVSGLYGTVVNGVTNSSITAQGITSIQWNLTNGGDLIVMDNANVAGNVTIGGGSGANGIALGSVGPVRVGGNLAIDGGTSNGSIVVSRTTTVGGLSIIGGLGSGQNSITMSNSTIGTNLLIIGGPGPDQIQQTQVTVNGQWNISASSGNDMITINSCIALGAATFNSGLGTDVIAVGGGRFDAGLTLDGSTGGGVKKLSMSGVVYTGTATLRGGEQSDLIVFTGSLGGTAVFDTAGGLDNVLVQYSILDELFAALGDGNDVFNLRGNRIKGLTSLDGGPGSNVLINTGNIFQGPVQRNRI